LANITICTVGERSEKGDGHSTSHARERRKIHTGFWWGKTKGKSHLEIHDVDGKILKCILKIQDRCAWTGVLVAQHRDQWHALVSTVMNIRAHNILGMSRLAGKLPASQERFCSMKLVNSVFFSLNVCRIYQQFSCQYLPLTLVSETAFSITLFSIKKCKVILLQVRCGPEGG